MTGFPAPQGGRPLLGLLPALALLGLGGIALRIPILAIPPILPVLHDHFRMSETEVGLLVGLPLGLFALVAVPGSLLVARLGARMTLLGGMAVAGVASGARGLVTSLPALYAVTIVMAAGVSVMQPALPRLVRDWVPERIGLGTAIYTNGMLIGAVSPIGLTGALVMPLVDRDWRADLLVWAVPVIVITLISALGLRAMPNPRTHASVPDRWWPDWKSPLTWMLGLTFASNNSMYFALNSVLPEFLTDSGRSGLIGSALLWLNLAQVVALVSMLFAAERLLHRAWPYLVFGPLAFLGIVGLAYLDGAWMIASSTLVGLTTAMTFGTTLALPPLLSRPDDVHRTAAGTFTIAYACAIVIPILCGALWDATGIPRLAFIPVLACAAGLTVFGALVTQYRRPPPDRVGAA